MHLFSLIHLGTCTKIQLLFSFTGLYGHSAVYYAGKRMILVFGGYRFRIDSVSPSDALYSLDMDSDTWHLLQALPSNEVGLVSCKKKNSNRCYWTQLLCPVQWMEFSVWCQPDPDGSKSATQTIQTYHLKQQKSNNSTKKKKHIVSLSTMVYLSSRNLLSWIKTHPMGITSWLSHIDQRGLIKNGGKVYF